MLAVNATQDTILIPKHIHSVVLVHLKMVVSSTIATAIFV